MPAYTYQVALKDHGQWFTDYVCAEDRVGAVYQFLVEHPPLTLEFLLDSEEFEVERCN